MNLNSCLATQTLQKAVHNLCATIVFTQADGAASKRNNNVESNFTAKHCIGDLKQAAV